MTDRAGFFAGISDILTDMCLYYFVAGILILSRDTWGVHLGWLLLCAAVCAAFFSVLLRKPRSVPLLAVLTILLYFAVFGVFWLVSLTPMRFGYGFLLAVGAGMAVGLPLYTVLHRPVIHRHLTRLDILILALAALLLVKDALGIDGGTVALMVAVLLLDAAGAVALRMSDGETGDGTNALRASMIALVSAALLALVITLLTMVFSRSGGFTDAVLSGIGSFFSSLGRMIERFFLWLTAFFTPRETESAPIFQEEIPSLAGVEQEAETLAGSSYTANPTVVGIVFAVILVVIAAAVAIRLRRKKIRLETNQSVSSSHSSVRRTGGTAYALWLRLIDRLRFLWTAFVNRDTPGGLLLLLERRARRAHAPRGRGETMRRFLSRMDTGGGLDCLADALDREYYGGGQKHMNTKQCRELRRYILHSSNKQRRSSDCRV